MRTAFILFALIFLLLFELDAQWLSVADFSCDYWLHSGASLMVYQNSGGAYGYASTTDRGLHWKRAASQAVTPYPIFFFLTTEIGWQVNSAVCSRTTDGGETWIKMTQATKLTGTPRSVLFTDSLNGYLSFTAGLYGTQVFGATTDGGKNWKSITLPYQDNWGLIQLSQTNEIILAGKKYIIASSDKGASWRTVYSDVNNVSQIHCKFFSSSSWWVSTASGTYSTADRGTTYTLNTQLPANLIDMQFTDIKSGYACSLLSLMKTTDGGATWCAFPSQPKNLSKIQSMYVSPTGEIYLGAQTHQYGIYKYTGETPALSLIFPNNPLAVISGSTQTVKWSSTGMNGNTITILYSSNLGKSWDILKAGIPIESDSENVRIPPSAYNKGKIKICVDKSPWLTIAGDYFSFTVGNSKILFAPNEIAIYLYSYGTSAYNNSGNGSSGLYWPGGASGYQTAVFEDGLLFGGKLNDELHICGSTYRTGLRPGGIIKQGDSLVSNSLSAGIFTLKKNWESLPDSAKEFYKAMYEAWPAPYGAPYEDINRDGMYNASVDKPFQYGDDMAWFAANDLDSNSTRFLYGTLPVGIEMQCLTFGYNSPPLKDVLYKKYTLINRSKNTVRDMYFGYWSDTDLGDANDDFVGCDSVRGIGYCYNGDNNDAGANGYGANPPAVGYVVVQGPVIPGNGNDSAFFDHHWIKGKRNLGMTTFIPIFKNYVSYFLDADLGVYDGAIQTYYYFQGLNWDGTIVNNPRTGVPTKFCLNGDPVAGTGWYQGPIGWPGGIPPGDRRLIVISGPFDFAPGETQEFVIAYVIARGTDNINSIKVMRELADTAKAFYYTIQKPYYDTVIFVPEKFSLEQNYPNPFNPTTTIKYELPVDGRVVLKIYNALGELVETLLNEEKLAGTYSAQFNAKHYSSGVYFYQMEYSGMRVTKKMMVLK